MEVIAPEHLVLPTDEAAAIAEARGGKSLDAGQFEQALDLAQGWVAGLILMLEAARSGVAIRTIGVDKPPEFLFDYFAGEVAGLLDEKERRTLMRLAAMPSMTAEAAATLADDPDAGELLERLAGRGYFTTRDAQAHPNYRFHPLFQSFLADSARKAFDGAERRRLNLAAAQALEGSGQPEAAAALLRDASAWEEMTRLILSWADELEATGRHKALASWINNMPSGRVETSPWLLYWSGVARQPFAPREGRPLFRQSLPMFVEAGDAAGAFLAWSRLSMSILHDEAADQTQLDELISILHDLKKRYRQYPSAEVEAYVATVMFGALARRTADRVEIAHWRQAAFDAAERAGKPKLLAYFRFVDIAIALIDGDHAHVREQIARLPTPESLREAPYERAMVSFATGFAQIWSQTPGSCVETATRALADNDRAGVYAYSHSHCSFAISDCIIRGDVDSARIWLQRCGEYMDRFYQRRPSTYFCCVARIELASGHLGVAVAAARRAVEIAVGDNYLYNEALARFVLAQALTAVGELRDAERELDAMKIAGDNAAIDSMRYRRELLHAEILQLTGREAQGLEVLRAGLAFGESKDERIIHLHRPIAARIFARALKHGFSPELVRRLISVMDLQPPEDCGPEWPWPLKIVTFGGLRLFKDGNPLPLSRKTPRRLFNVLKAIAAFGGKDIAQEKIIDAVWPDEDGDCARQSFDVAVHRLRKLIGDNQAIVVKGGRVGFDPTRCWLDTRAFESGLSARGASPADVARTLALYAGDFLADDEDLPWAAPRRKYLREKFFKMTEAQAGR